LLAGLAIAAGLLWLGQRRSTRVAALALPWWMLCAVAGTLMLFLWGFTAHRFAWANHNLLLLNPLCLGLLPGAWRIARGRADGRMFRVLLWVIAALALLAPFLLWLPALPQRNAHWIALLLPVQGAFAAVLLRTRPAPVASSMTGTPA
jgi:type VI protein secretion system component VasF